MKFESAEYRIYYLQLKYKKFLKSTSMNRQLKVYKLMFLEIVVPFFPMSNFLNKAVQKCSQNGPMPSGNRQNFKIGATA